MRSQIQDIARNCDPQIIIDIQEYENIVIVTVKEGIDKPYSCSDGFFMRMGANAQKLKRDEILNFAIKSGKIRFDEQVCENFDWNDFDEAKFKEYLKLANINSSLSRDNILTNLNVLTDQGITNAGVLFFAKKPARYIRSSKVTCVLFKGNERINILDRKIFDDGILENIFNMVNYVERHIDVKFLIEKLEREEIPQYPHEAYREAIVNAVMHKDYADLSEDLCLEIYRNKIIIRNPGGLFGLTIKDLGKKSRTRNSLIADLLLRTPYVEKLGTGFLRMNDAMHAYHLNNVVPASDEFSFSLELSSTQETTQEKMKKISTKDKIIENLSLNNGLTKDELAGIIGVSSNAIKQHLANLKKNGILRRVGSTKAGHWEIKKSD